ncbi:MAG: sulfotransferase [Gammaproteobacteria bacterium]
MTLTSINKPNFFILGAGRSGSTQLYHLLRQHPDVFLTNPKEPSFFCEPFQVIKNPIEYFELYDAVSDEAIRGEASHVYLTNPTTAKVLKGLFPEARFVVILRNPAERAYSLYQWMRRYRYEPVHTFEAALEEEESRYNSASFRADCPQYFYNYLYFMSGLYGQQLQRYFSLFSKQQFHIVKFEEFIVDPANHLKEIFRFLDVDQGFSPQLAVDRNEGDAATYEPLSIQTKELLLEAYSSDLHHLSDMTGISF